MDQVFPVVRGHEYESSILAANYTEMKKLTLEKNWTENNLKTLVFFVNSTKMEADNFDVWVGVLNFRKFT